MKKIPGGISAGQDSALAGNLDMWTCLGTRSLLFLPRQARGLVFFLKGEDAHT